MQYLQERTGSRAEERSQGAEAERRNVVVTLPLPPPRYRIEELAAARKAVDR